VLLHIPHRRSARPRYACLYWNVLTKEDTMQRDNSAQLTIDLGIAEDDRKRIVDGLSRLLADAFTLYLKTHNYHWNVTGPQFRTLHLMFEELYNEQWTASVAVHGRAGRCRAPAAAPCLARPAHCRRWRAGDVEQADVGALVRQPASAVARIVTRHARWPASAAAPPASARRRRCRRPPARAAARGRRRRAAGDVKVLPLPGALAVRATAAAVQLDQALHQRQAQAQAALRAVGVRSAWANRSNTCGAQFRRHADAVVAHAHHAVRRVRPRAHAQLDLDAPPSGVYLAALLSRLASTCTRRLLVARAQRGRRAGAGQPVAARLDQRAHLLDRVGDDRAHVDRASCPASPGRA
jgi:hypothetical protein